MIHHALNNEVDLLFNNSINWDTFSDVFFDDLDDISKGKMLFDMSTSIANNKKD